MFDYIGIDWGSKKCGIALGASDTGIVTPSLIVPTVDIVGKITQIASEKKSLRYCVIGENKSFQRKITHNSIASQKLKKELRAACPALDVVLYDERGSTKTFGKDQDHFAAAEILRNYFQYQLK